MNEIIVQNQYNQYPDIIVYDQKNPVLSSPYADTDLLFYQTRDTLQDVDVFRTFIKNAESRFRARPEYKAYKSYLIESLGINRCQVFGNITTDNAEIELHHNVIGLFDICLLITLHIVNTVGYISTFDLIQILIMEHWSNRVGITFLSKTAHQIYTNDPDAYIPPDMTFGRWWELLNNYRYGITFSIATKVLNYIKKYQEQLPISINIQQQEEILNYAYFNEYGMPKSECGDIPNNEEFEGGYSDYGF
jgi:hypothetical protein